MRLKSLGYWHTMIALWSDVQESNLLCPRSACFTLIPPMECVVYTNTAYRGCSASRILIAAANLFVASKLFVGFAPNRKPALQNLGVSLHCAQLLGEQITHTKRQIRLDNFLAVKERGQLDNLFVEVVKFLLHSFLCRVLVFHSVLRLFRFYRVSPAAEFTDDGYAITLTAFGKAYCVYSLFAMRASRLFNLGAFGYFRQFNAHKYCSFWLTVIIIKHN